MRRIIGIGNRYVARDALGPRVCDRLRATPLPHGVEVVDGGTAGLDLLLLLDGIERVVFVDGVQGFGRPGEIIVLESADVVALAPPVHDHSAGLPFLLRAAAIALDPPVPEVFVVGCEGEPDAPTVDRVAQACLDLAVEERPRATRRAPSPEVLP